MIIDTLLKTGQKVRVTNRHRGTFSKKGVIVKVTGRGEYRIAHVMIERDRVYTYLPTELTVA